MFSRVEMSLVQIQLCKFMIKAVTLFKSAMSKGCTPIEKYMF